MNEEEKQLATDQFVSQDDEEAYLLEAQMLRSIYSEEDVVFHATEGSVGDSGEPEKTHLASK